MKLSDEEGSDMTEYIVGTHMDDLSQIYNGRVSIKGSASIENVLVLKNEDNIFQQQINSSQIILNNMSFDLLNLQQQYWVKTTDQVQWIISIPKRIIHGLIHITLYQGKN